jgi:hypothetical protein
MGLMALTYSVFSRPAVMCIGLEGFLLFHLSWSGLLIPLLLLSGIAMGGIGSLIGLLSPEEGMAGLIGNLVMMGGSLHQSDCFHRLQRDIASSGGLAAFYVWDGHPFATGAIPKQRPRTADRIACNAGSVPIPRGLGCQPP